MIHDVQEVDATSEDGLNCYEGLLLPLFVCPNTVWEKPREISCRHHEAFNKTNLNPYEALLRSQVVASLSCGDVVEQVRGLVCCQVLGA